jgi:hypothetical protein
MTFKITFNKINKIITLPVIAVLLIPVTMYLYNKHEENEKQQATLISKQLSGFYIPLNSVLKASYQEWVQFRRKHGANRQTYFDAIIGVKGEDGVYSYTRACNTRNKPVALNVSALPRNNNVTELVIKRCPVSNEEITAWELQMKATFKPYQDKMESLVLDRRHLVGADKYINSELDKLLLHISGYKIVYLKWEKGDYTQVTSHNDFPAGLQSLVQNKINELSVLLKDKYSHVKLH